MLVLVVINDLVAYQGNQILIESEQGIVGAQSALTELSTMLATLDDAETGQRGYLLTGNVAYLQPYTNAHQAIITYQHALTTMLANDPLQEQRLTQLAPLVDDKFAELQQTIDLYNQHQTQAALQVVNTGYGKQKMAAIRQLIGQMQATENQMVAQREAAAQQVTQQTRGATGFATLVAILCIIFLGRTIVRAVVKSQQLNRQLEHAFVALQAANDELTQQNERVQEANRIKSHFLANMSHELRTPLTGILGFTELVQRQILGPLNAEQLEYMGDIMTSARHLLQLINDILDLSKIEAGKMRFFPEMLQLPYVVNEVCEIVQPMASSKHITLTQTIDPSLSEVMLDPAKFKQVLYNFLSNGIKFTPEKGEVRLELHAEDGERFRVEVIDTGIGIAPGELHKLFQPFQQLDASTTKQYAGTGLGLALTKQIVEAQGGTIGVSSEVGVGSRFWATFPCWSAPFLTPIVPNNSNENKPILIVEDDAPERGWIAQMLGEAGYAVHHAMTGTQALSMCSMHTYAAILLDLFLPDMNGWQILKVLRASGPNQATSVIVITVAAVGDLVLEQPVQAVLSKPLRRAELLAAVQGNVSLPALPQAA